MSMIVVQGHKLLILISNVNLMHLSICINSKVLGLQSNDISICIFPQHGSLFECRIQADYCQKSNTYCGTYKVRTFIVDL